jgi:type IV secretory pathway VirB10-like protein
LGKNRFKKILTKTTMGFLLMSSVVPYNVLAESPSQNTIQGTLQSSSSQTGSLSLTQAQIEAMNKINTENEITISPKINVNSSEPVRVIVEFKQAPAEVSVIQEQYLEMRFRYQTLPKR